LIKAGRHSEPLLPATSTPISSFPFFLMAAFKLINGYSHKSSKPKSVPSPKEMSNQWNGMGVVFSGVDGLQRARFMVDDDEIGEIWSAMDKFSRAFYSMFRVLIFSRDVLKCYKYVIIFIVIFLCFLCK
jgi:hypothetical protein